jgi:hypothetical protein
MTISYNIGLKSLTPAGWAQHLSENFDKCWEIDSNNKKILTMKPKILINDNISVNLNLNQYFN